ncbi:hypothetical protein ACTID9_28720 (plasmid) [Brevibacillus fluminis]|uniref:hypothetical protein n=1 Tax=Brevibacillus fluminis TaxID=511487 RepID=UPI003F895A3E
MDFLINGISDVLNTMATALPGFSWAHDLAADVAALKPYFDKANVLMPVDTVLIVLGLWVALQIVLAAYYWITRTINLIRGAG